MEKNTKILFHLLGDSQIAPQDTTTTFTREDGTTITVVPELDKLGNQLYEQVFNPSTGVFQCIPKYLIRCDELKQLFGS